MKNEKPRSDATLENFLLLKSADADDELEFTDLMNFCWTTGNTPCESVTHEFCTIIIDPEIYCTRSPLERDYREYLASSNSATREEYLHVRLGKTQCHH